MKNAVVTKDRFGIGYTNGQIWPHDLKQLGMAFAWKCANGQYRPWYPSLGYGIRETEIEALENVYCFNYNC